MGLFAALFDKPKEQRSGPPEWLARWMGGEPSASGVTVSDGTALKYTAFYSAIDAISRSVGQVPLFLYRRVSEKERQKAGGHPLYRLLHTRPNGEQTAFIFRQTMQSWCLRWGNAYAEVERNGAGRPTALWHLRSDRMGVRRNDAGQLVYDKYNDLGRVEKTFGASDVLHIRTMGDGMIGYSPIQLFRETVGLGLAAEKTSAALIGNGIRASGVFSHPGKLGPQAVENLDRSIREKHGGPANRGKVMILEEGMKWTQLTIPPEDAQFLETRQFGITEIARIFHIPPHKLADLTRATFSNIVEQSLEYLGDCLNPWLVNWEQELDFKLLLPAEENEYYAEFNVDGLLRADTKSRNTAHRMAIQDGWKTRNEVRREENLNPIDGLDEPLVPQNMGPASQLEDKPEEPPPVVQDEDDRAEVVAAFKALLLDACEQVVRKETNALRTAWKRPESFPKAVSRFLEHHDTHICRVLGPVLGACAAALGADLAGVPEQVAALARNHIAEMQDDLNSDSRRAGWLASGRGSIEATCPALWADTILEDLIHATAEA